MSMMSASPLRVGCFVALAPLCGVRRAAATATAAAAARAARHTAPTVPTAHSSVRVFCARTTPVLPSALPLRARVCLSSSASPSSALPAAPRSSGSDVVDVSDATFEKEVLEHAHCVVVDCYATWCAPCTMLRPVLEKVVLEADAPVRLAKLDVDENPGVASALRVQAMPTVIGFVGGKPVAQFVGAVTEDVAREFVVDLLKKKKDAKTEKHAGKTAKA